MTFSRGRELAKESNRYYGRSILTPHAKLELIAQIGNFLEKRLLEEYYTSENVQQHERTNDYFVRNILAIIKWYKSREKEKKDPSWSRSCQYMNIVTLDGGGTGFHLLAQSLSGFNEAC